MTVGGTGDVLSGLIAGFIAQGNSLIDSASASAYLCGYVGDRLFKENKGPVNAEMLSTLEEIDIRESRVFSGGIDN